MADNKKLEAEAAPQNAGSGKEVKKTNANKVVLIVVGVVLVVSVTVFAAAASFVSFVRRYMPAPMTAFQPYYGNTHHRFMGINPINPTNGSVNSRLSGVVTQVSGNSFVIAGNGTTKTITTNSETIYSNGLSKVNVNDSVIVLGSETNGVFTASSVRVINL